MKSNIPKKTKDWIIDISEAYKDATETVPFAKILNKELTEENFFHLAPDICIKRRKIERTKENRKKASDAALCSYVATQGNIDGILDNPILTFSLAYLASHFGLDIVSEINIMQLMDYIENNIDEIKNKL
ncbi:MAG: hypothetical protein U9O87_04370 [Verrucomicrobiota bacterium]|nr:hypothetical protein [Verrucomicrobiota bacterium]